MADTADKVDSGVEKVQKANPFDTEENRKSAWTKAEKMISKGKSEGALLALREVDSSGSHPTTLRLAGEATHKIAKSARNKGGYRKAASLLKESVKNAPNDKRANASYNELLNEMQDLGYSETSMPRLLNDGTPTLAGMVAMGMALVLVLAAITVANTERTVTATEAYLNVTWTDSSGLFNDEVITINWGPAVSKNPYLTFAYMGSKGDTIELTWEDNQGNKDFTKSDGTGGHAVVWSGYCNGAAASSSSDCAKTDWTLPDEADNGMLHEPYVLSMAKTSAANTGGSQFFIVSPGSTPSHLDGVHTVFGKVIEGQDIIDKIDAVETGGDQGSTPAEYPVTLIDASFSGESSSSWWPF